METQAKIVYTPKTEESWDIPGVAYRRETGTYRIFEQMILAMNQSRLSEFYEREKPRGNPHPMDSALHFAVFSAAHSLKSISQKEAEGLRTFLHQGLRKYPNTLTRISYDPSGKDAVTHNHGTSDAYSMNGNIVGPDGYIADLHDKNALELLLATEDVAKINRVFQWVNGTDGYIWRLNSKSEKNDERVVGFKASSDWLSLDCSRDPSYGYPAFRVLKVD